MAGMAFPSQRVPNDFYYLCCHSTTGSGILITMGILITFLHTVTLVSTYECDLEILQPVTSVWNVQKADGTFYLNVNSTVTLAAFIELPVRIFMLHW